MKHSPLTIEPCLYVIERDRPDGSGRRDFYHPTYIGEDGTGWYGALVPACVCEIPFGRVPEGGRLRKLVLEPLDAPANNESIMLTRIRDLAKKFDASSSSTEAHCGHELFEILNNMNPSDKGENP